MVKFKATGVANPPGEGILKSLSLKGLTLKESVLYSNGEMKFTFIYFGEESAAILIGDVMLVLGDKQVLNSGLTPGFPDAKIFTISLIFSDPERFKEVQKINEDLELTLYSLDKKSYSVLIRKGKYRFFYATSQFFQKAGKRIEEVITDLGGYFSRRLDFAILPVTQGENALVVQFLKKIKPRYLAPLLVEGGNRVIEEFLEKFGLNETAVLIYNQLPEVFGFNLI